VEIQPTADAKDIFQQARFKFSWRPYQARILESFAAHGADGHFHFVAPPGSGKTVLGIEILRRIGHPTLVFAPTTAVRDQWIDRFVHGFLPDGQSTEWISRDLSKPGLLTVVTYQALHYHSKPKQRDRLVQDCIETGIQTLVLDEAHHLRNDWWRCLHDLKAKLSKPVIVALTATPPWDVSRIEWNRYMHLCGPIDEEISIPELVKAGNLCPHQDFLALVTPSSEHTHALQQYEFQIRSILNDLAIDEVMIQRLIDWGHKEVAAARTPLDTESIHFYLSLALFLNFSQGMIPEDISTLLDLNLDEIQLPPFHAGWAEILLNRVYASKLADDPLFRKFHSRLKATGAIQCGKIHLQTSPRLEDEIAEHPSRIAKIASIIEHEYSLQRWDLRAVILSDRIHEDAFPSQDVADDAHIRVGVAPVFEHLRKLRLPNLRIAMITGGFSIVPTEALPYLIEGIPSSQRSGLSTEVLWWDSSYTRVTLSNGDGSGLLAPFTRLLNHGTLHVVVGTCALLGEGWDAPAVNTLILATNTSAAVSSNQMRGRALRVDPEAPFKTSHIWHIATLKSDHRILDCPNPPGTENAPLESVSLESIRKRFESFPGLAHEGVAVENGIARIGTLDNLSDSGFIDHWNARMFKASEERHSTFERWHLACSPQFAPRQRLFDELLIPPNHFPPSPGIPAHWITGRSLLSKLVRAWITRKTRLIIIAVFHALMDADLLDRKIPARAIQSTMTPSGIRITLDKSSTRDQNTLVENILCLFDVVQPARYIIASRGRVYMVPPYFAKNLELATRFLKHWRKHAGSAKLLSARSKEGQILLLREREAHLLNRIPQPVSRHRRWS